jgi:hypothetical protein
MKSLDKLDRVIEEKNSELDKISNAIRSLEKKLQSSPFPKFFFKIPDSRHELIWDNGSKRLILWDCSILMERPLIESKIDIKREIYMHLDSFIEELLKFSKE